MRIATLDRSARTLVGQAHSGTPGGVRRAGNVVTLDATLYDPATGRRMILSSDQPGLQFYTGNLLDGTTYGPAGKQYRQGDGLCLETPHFPDSPNRGNSPSTRLDRGQTYKTRTIHNFPPDASPSPNDRDPLRTH